MHNPLGWKKNNSADYKDWGYYSITGIGGVGAIYSVSYAGYLVNM